MNHHSNGIVERWPASYRAQHCRSAVLAMAMAMALSAAAGCHRRAPTTEPPVSSSAPGWQAGALWLPPPATDAGVLVRMLIAECQGPAYPDYDEREAYWAMQAMKAVVHNRLVHDPARFGAPGARTYADIICAPGQWAGFGRGPRGEYAIEPAVVTRVDEIVLQANTGPPGPHHRFVHNALAITYGGAVDPFAHLRWIDGTAVYPGAYGWRRHGTAPPGGAFVAIPPAQGGVRAGNQFYALVAP